MYLLWLAVSVRSYIVCVCMLCRSEEDGVGEKCGWARRCAQRFRHKHGGRSARRASAACACPPTGTSKSKCGRLSYLHTHIPLAQAVLPPFRPESCHSGALLTPSPPKPPPPLLLHSILLVSHSHFQCHSRAVSPYMPIANLRPQGLEGQSQRDVQVGSEKIAGLNFSLT